MSDHAVASPLPGIFYRRPAPDAPPFVEEGGEVSEDSVVGLVEVMKQFAEIHAGAAGTVSSFAVEDGAVLGPGDTVAVVATA
jgi:biotin carboxyl carrier protein